MTFEARPDVHCQCKYYMMTLECTGEITPLRVTPLEVKALGERFRIVAFVYASDAENAYKLTRAWLIEQGRPPNEAECIVARELGKAGDA